MLRTLVTQRVRSRASFLRYAGTIVAYGVVDVIVAITCFVRLIVVVI